MHQDFYLRGTELQKVKTIQWPNFKSSLENDGSISTVESDYLLPIAFPLKEIL